MTSPSALERPEALRILLDASALLLASPSESAILEQMMELACAVLEVDGYAVWRAYDEGRSWKVIAKRGLSSDYRTEVEASGEMPEAVWRVQNALSDPRLGSDREAYRREGIRSMLVMPWKLATTVRGTIVFYSKTERKFTERDEDYACALANLTVSALSRLELEEQSGREKRRLGFLAEASEVLASSLDYEATLDRVAHLAVEKIADWCTVHLVEDGEVIRLVTAHADPDMTSFVTEYAERYPETIVPDRGLGRVLATGAPEVYPRITDEMVSAAARDEDHLGMLRKLALTSSILVPLIAQGKVLGAIRLLGASGRHFTDEDVQLAQDLARRSAVAIENARLHRAVLEQENELRLSHAAAHMGSWSWDLERHKIYWSDEFKALHGLPRDTQASFEGGSGLVHPEDRERVMTELAEALASPEELVSFEHRVLTPDGRLAWLQNRGRVKRNQDGKAIGIAGLTIDVTESRLAEQALRRTEKLAAAGRLAATVAHEVNNPLEALVNLIYLAQRTEGLPEQARLHLQIADGELSRMAHIVRQTLGFYRESSVPQIVRLDVLAGEVLELYKSRAGTRGVNLLLEREPEQTLTARVNAGEIKQVVANLVSNAIDASTAGGTVSASVRRDGERVEIVVCDEGSGISEANRKHLFEPFFTTKSDVGTGLGLWVSKGIVEKHGGTIAVDPFTAVGTTMRVGLPAC